MADELRLALILLGTLAIGAVILHGIWTVRKTVNEEKKLAKAKQEPQETEVEAIDEEEKAANLHQMEMDFTEIADNPEGQGMPVAAMNVDSIYQEQETEGQDEIEAEPELDHPDMFEAENEDNKEPVIGNFSAIENEDVETNHSLEHELVDERSVGLDKPQVKQSATKQDVLILFVDKPEGAAIEGAKLLPLLLTLGFKFGEMDFFHRHEDNAGKGEVLFSLANMYNPGTFDIDKMEQISTRGLTMFMTLPNAAEPLQTFNMMHNAAKKIADEFDAVVLDGNRQPLDVAIVRSYVEKIRKFQN